MSVATRVRAGSTTLSGSAQLVDASTAAIENIKSVSVRASTANTAKCFLGPAGVTTGTGYELSAGESIAVDINSTLPLFVIGTAADKVTWIATA